MIRDDLMFGAANAKAFLQGTGGAAARVEVNRSMWVVKTLRKRNHSIEVRARQKEQGVAQQKSRVNPP